MIRRDWSLVFFTMLAQTSVGISLCLAVIMLVRPVDDLVIPHSLIIGNPLLLAFLLMAVATVVSFLHLGTPLNAPKSLKNLKTSWLSREILAIQVYSLCLVGLILLHWRGFEAGRLWLLFGLLAAGGVALLWSMSRIYMLPTIPPWKSWYTPVSFVSTALSLGILTLLLLSDAQWLVITGPISKTFHGVLMAVVFIEFGSSIAHQAGLKNLPAGLGRPEFTTGAFNGIFIVRITILAITLLAMLFFGPPAALLAAPLVAQEVFGRLLFYASYFRSGV